MKTLLSALLICACLSAYSQNEFAVIKDEVNTWYASIESTSIISSKTPKTIDFKTQHYSICGIIAKGILCEGTTAKFYETTSLVPEILLEGKVSYQASRLVVEGIRYIKTSIGTNKIYGTFYVYNMDDFSMNYKLKKAGALRIRSSQVSYLEGFYLKCPAIVRINDNSVYIDGKTGGRGYSFLSTVIPNITLNDDDSFDIYQMLLQARDDVTMCWEDGVMFEGRVRPTIKEDGVTVFQNLDGQRTGMTSGPKKITVRHENGDIVYTQEDNDDNQLLSKETMYVKDDGTLSETDCWNMRKIYEHCHLAKWTYRSGNYFEGSIKSVITADRISSTATKGVFKYLNGDRFEGDVSTKTVGSFPVDGTTILADGTKLKGNWLEKYKLTSSQWEKIYNCQNPSEAIALAKRLMRSNYYQEYKYSGSIEYFNPEEEHPSSTYADYVTYDKTKKCYSCRYKPTDENIQLKFAVDDKGFRKWEIVYGNNSKPEFITDFTWYSNGEIESIKSYHYSTKKIYLSCNFFSDGKLRSAYQYGLGRSGEIILRKTKESHPSFGGYTCKLYDLNGNYERSIDWEIGKWIWGMAPARLEFNKLKPIE